MTYANKGKKKKNDDNQEGLMEGVSEYD
jgi:hypothetical protein